MLSIYKSDHSLPVTFDIGFLIAVACLFYFPSIVFLLVFYASLVILRPFVWREWVISLLGFLLPFFFCWLYYFWKGATDEIINTMASNLHKAETGSGFSWTGTNLIFPAVAGFVSVLGFISLMGNFYKSVIRTRNFQQVLFIMLLAMLLPVLISRSYFAEMSLLICIPLSIAVSNYFAEAKRILFLEVLFLLILSGVVFLHIR